MVDQILILFVPCIHYTSTDGALLASAIVTVTGSRGRIVNCAALGSKCVKRVRIGQ